MVYFFHNIVSKFILKPTPLNIALPFKEDKWDLPYEDDLLGDEDNDNFERDLEDDNVGNTEPLRITTRANIPYNLAGYTKNAMLLINPETYYPRQYDDTIPDKMTMINATFSKFQFEIEQYADLTDEEVDEKCQYFFQRDFTDYGCVAVVLLKPDGCRIDDAVIIRHWTTNGNPTLRDKPKFYLNEFSHHYAFRRSYNAPSYSVPITDNHPDVLCLHLPAIFISLHRDFLTQPLDIFCSKLTAMAEEDLMTIIKETIQELEPMFRSLTFVTTTQKRKLFLLKTPQDLTRVSSSFEASVRVLPSLKGTWNELQEQIQEGEDHERLRAEREDFAVENPGTSRITTREKFQEIRAQNSVKSPGPSKITTRASSYNLEEYSKNAMLLLNLTEINYPGQYDDTIFDKIATITETFVNFRFEIEQCSNMREDEFEEKCYNFFQRDFTDYGCIAVVFLKPDGCRIDDSSIIKYWIADGNPTLRDKPKLYINEFFHHYAFKESYNGPNYSVPVTDYHPDVLCLHLPTILDKYYLTQPLNLLCTNLSTMADENLMTIIKETIKDLKPVFKGLTFLTTTQKKMLFLS